jgi:hypothetical protein
MRTPATANAFAAFAERADRLRPGIARVGSSDYHVGLAPGFCRTWVLARVRSAAGVSAAVREGRTVAMDMDGRLYGSAEAVRLVQDANLAKPAPPRPAGLERGAAAAAVLGLLLLALL